MVGIARGRVAFFLLLASWTLGCGEPQRPTGIRVEVGRLALDPETSQPVLLLREAEGGRVLPIWIGPTEAESIAVRLSGIVPPRPNSHDLTKRLIDRLAGQVVSVLVNDLRDGIYFARIGLAVGDERVEVDARPSDAIALALRYDAPIFVRERLFALPRPEAPDRQVERLRL